jgi:hypothetical protein
VSHPPPGQPYYQGQPDPNQPPYGGGYPGGSTSGAGPSWPEQAQPYSGGPAYPPQQPVYGDPNYGAQPQSGGPAYPNESYSTEPPYSGQPYSGQPYSGQSYGQGFGQASAPPGYDPGYQSFQQPATPYQQPPPPRRGRGGLIALLASIGVLVLLVCGISGVALLRSSNDKPAAHPTTPAPSAAATAASPSAAAPSTPAANAEYPATIVLPSVVAGLPKLNNADLQKTADDTAVKLKNETDADSAVAGYYAPNGDVTKAVGIVGVTAKIADPQKELTTAFSSTLQISQLQTVAPGPLGGVMQCGNTSSDGIALTICGWADHGSLALGIFLNHSLNDSAALFVKIRAEILKRG